MSTFNQNAPQTGFQNNGYGNNYNNYSPTTSVNANMMSPPPAIIGFVQGKMGASMFPLMSSNTTAYLFDVLDQSKFYIKSTDVFGMAQPLREFKYEEVFQTPEVPKMVPQVNNTVVAPPVESTNTGISREEFEALKAQLAELQGQQGQAKQQSQPRQRKERTNNV